ncbi:MAG: hypothetical protein LBD30_09075, partial [Verrucomicrobiales bacterium]|nr:hypothetical protein [Verrucomicrobiales bacterium]
MLKYSLVIVAWLAVLPFADAEVKLPAIFGDHMVLQQGVALPVWGWAEAGERVTVSFAGRSAGAVADGEGKWRVELPPVEAGGQGRTLTVTGKNTITLQDVLVGEVWLAAGQSNMELGIQSADGGAAAVERANDPQLRMFFIPWAASLTVKDDFVRGRNALDGKWVVCTPENMKANWAWHGFSAV